MPTSKQEVKMSPRLKIKVPMIPNFLIDSNGHSYSIILFTETELRMVAKSWERELLKSRKRKLKITKTGSNE